LVLILLGLLNRPLEMFIEPVRQQRIILAHIGPTMPGFPPSDQLMRNLILRQFCDEPLGLFVRNSQIRIAVDDERRRRVLGNGHQGRQLPQQVDLFLFWLLRYAEHIPGGLDRIGA
jgi:hypothetical protein